MLTEFLKNVNSELTHLNYLEFCSKQMYKTKLFTKLVLLVLHFEFMVVAAILPPTDLECGAVEKKIFLLVYNVKM